MSHRVIIVPGLSDNNRGIEWAALDRSHSNLLCLSQLTNYVLNLIVFYDFCSNSL